MTVAVFHHDYPGVNENADSNGNTTQRHDVGGDPHHFHGDEGDQH